MIVPSKFYGYNKDGTRNLFMGGGGGGGPTQTTSTVTNSNIPEYAQGYVENMLGATQQQLFQGTRGPDVTNPETGQQTTVGNQQDEAVIVKEEQKEKSKKTIWLVLGGLVVALGVTFIVLKVKQNKAQ